MPKEKTVLIFERDLSLNFYLENHLEFEMWPISKKVKIFLSVSLIYRVFFGALENGFSIS